MVGRELLQYRVVKRLGRGGMGDVYLAEDSRLGRQVALKVLSASLASDRNFLKRFTREAKAVAALNHPNIVTLHALEESDGVHFLVLEYVEGMTLDVLLVRDGACPGRLREYGLKLADALIYAHGRGITHRDLKPSNIMVSADQRVKILDFGLAKIDPPGGLLSQQAAGTEMLTKAGSVFGTVGYMSPEQAQGKPADPRSDIFSLGVVLYEMSTGTHPFPGGDAAMRLAAILRDDPSPPVEVEARVDPALSRAIMRCLAKKPEQRFQDARELVAAFEGVEDTAATARTAVPAAATAHPAPEAAAESPSIAVLPFLDMSPAGDQAYFCDGMAEELIDGLSRLPGLGVASRTSTFRFRGEAPDVAEIGRALGVQSVLEGSVRTAGSRLRVSVHLVAVSSGHQLWSQRFDREAADVFAIQDDIARLVVDALELELTGDRERRLVSRQTIDLEAYHCYLKGRHQWGQRTEASLKKSIELFRQTIEVDPSYARAWAGMADSYALLGLYGSQPPRVVMPRAREAAERALELEPDLAEAHVSLACVLSLYEWRWEDARRAFQKALALDPDYPTGHHWYAMNHLVPLGRFEEALDHAREARRLDPLAPAVGLGVPLVDYFAGRYQDAARGLRELVELEPRFAAGHFFLGRALMQASDPDAAIAELETAVELSARSAEMVAALGWARASLGDADAAGRLLGELTARAESAYVGASLAAQIHVGLGDAAAAVGSLETGFAERSTDMAWLAVTPVFEGLRDKEAVRKLAGQMGLA